MKKFVLIIPAVFLYADITPIINKIKKIENYRVECKKIRNYKIFNYSSAVVYKTSSKKTKSPIILYAIFQNSAKINGTWVKEGDYIDGFMVIKITDSEVVLEKEGKKLILKPENNILKVTK